MVVCVLCWMLVPGSPQWLIHSKAFRRNEYLKAGRCCCLFSGKIHRQFRRSKPPGPGGTSNNKQKNQVIDCIVPCAFVYSFFQLNDVHYHCADLNRNSKSLNEFVVCESLPKESIIAIQWHTTQNCHECIDPTLCVSVVEVGDTLDFDLKEIYVERRRHVVVCICGVVSSDAHQPRRLSRKRTGKMMEKRWNGKTWRMRQKNCSRKTNSSNGLTVCWTVWITSFGIFLMARDQPHSVQRCVPSENRNERSERTPIQTCVIVYEDAGRQSSFAWLHFSCFTEVIFCQNARVSASTKSQIATAHVLMAKTLNLRCQLTAFRNMRIITPAGPVQTCIEHSVQSICGLPNNELPHSIRQPKES